jgi:hypothetical protein
MGQDDTGKTPAQDPPQGPSQDQPIAGPSQDEQGPPDPNLSTTAHDQPAADDLLHAAYVLPADMVANVELTLDHLSTTLDLFDVPPFDYGAAPHDPGDTA